MERLSHIVVGLFCLLMGALGVFGARSLPYIADGQPGSGFFPTVLAFTLLVCAAGICWLSIRSTSTSMVNMAAVKKSGFFIAGLMLFSLAFPDILGFFPALIIFYILALRFSNGLPWRYAIINGCACFAILYFLFVFWLNVAMPWGYIFDRLRSAIWFLS